MAGGRLLALAILAASVGKPAVALAEKPETVLVQILAHDFEGDGDFRFNQAVYTRPDPTAVRDCNCTDLPRELFDATIDPIVVVSDWKMMGPAPSTGTDVAFKVRYRVLAVTKGKGNSTWPTPRRILPLAAARDEEITYRLSSKNGHWKLVDPPLPRVGSKGLMHVVQQQIDDDERIVRTLRDSPATPIKTSGPFRDAEWNRGQLQQLKRAFGN